MRANAIPENLFKFDLVDNIQRVAAFDFKQVGRDDRIDVRICAVFAITVAVSLAPKTPVSNN